LFADPFQDEASFVPEQMIHGVVMVPEESVHCKGDPLNTGFQADLFAKESEKARIMGGNTEQITQAGPVSKPAAVLLETARHKEFAPGRVIPPKSIWLQIALFPCDYCRE